jgi:hypothetical protein
MSYLTEKERANWLRNLSAALLNLILLLLLISWAKFNSVMRELSTAATVLALLLGLLSLSGKAYRKVVDLWFPTLGFGLVS